MRLPATPGVDWGLHTPPEAEHSLKKEPGNAIGKLGCASAYLPLKREKLDKWRMGESRYSSNISFRGQHFRT